MVPYRGGMRRDHWRRRNDGLDPETEHVEIYRNLAVHEFPWDLNQALSFALFRTYAVPAIGRLLHETGEFTGRTQKRYDDTALLLEAPLTRGFSHPEARAAIRRINQMHRVHDIPHDQMRYVLSTFVVVPKRWLDDYGKRPMTSHEVRASVRYYQELGRHLGIRDVPEDYAGFEELMDSYEAEHFAFDPGARKVADATLALLLTFHPRVPGRLVEAFSRSLMDEPLRRAFGFADPPRAVVRLSRAGLRARGRLLRLAPARRDPKTVADLWWIRSYPDGYDVARLGTFPGNGCPASGVPLDLTETRGVPDA